MYCVIWYYQTKEYVCIQHHMTITPDLIVKAQVLNINKFLNCDINVFWIIKKFWKLNSIGFDWNAQKRSSWHNNFETLNQYQKLNANITTSFNKKLDNGTYYERFEYKNIQNGKKCLLNHKKNWKTEFNWFWLKCGEKITMA